MSFDPLVKAYERNRNKAPAYWQLDILWLILASGEDTGGAFSVMEELCPKDSGPPPHIHDQFEFFYILDGAITFLVDGQEIRGVAGSIVTIPAGVVHSFRVDTETARGLNIYIPAGFERMIIEFGEPATERSLPPRGRQLTASPENMRQLMAKIGMHASNEPDKLRNHSDSRMDVGGQ